MSRNRSQIPSPARSVGSARKSRNTLPAASPRTSSSSNSAPPSRPTSGSFFIRSPNRQSILNDNTEIDVPKRRSWWKKLAKNSLEIGDVLGNFVPQENIDFEEIVQPSSNTGILLSKKPIANLKNVSDSDTSESLGSINLPQRKLFTHRQTQHANDFENIVNRQELVRKRNNDETDKTIFVSKKDLFPKNKAKKQKHYPYPVPGTSKNANFTTDTTSNKVESTIAIDTEVLKKNLFGKRKENKKLPAFTNFIMSESEDEITLVQERLMAFKKNPPVLRRTSRRASKRSISPTSSVYSETMEMENWKLLPSSTMVEGGLITNTPAKKQRTNEAMNEICKNSKSDVTVLPQENPQGVEKNSSQTSTTLRKELITNTPSKNLKSIDANEIDDIAEADMILAQEDPQKVEKNIPLTSTTFGEHHITNMYSKQNHSKETIKEIDENIETNVVHLDQKVAHEIEKDNSSTIVREGPIVTPVKINHSNEEINGINNISKSYIADLDQEDAQVIEKDTSLSSLTIQDDLSASASAIKHHSNATFNEIAKKSEADVTDSDQENPQEVEKNTSITLPMVREDFITSTPAKNHHNCDIINEIDEIAEADVMHSDQENPQEEKDTPLNSTMVKEVLITSIPKTKKHQSIEVMNEINAITEAEFTNLHQEDLQEVEKATSLVEEDLIKDKPAIKHCSNEAINDNAEVDIMALIQENPQKGERNTADKLQIEKKTPKPVSKIHASIDPVRDTSVEHPVRYSAEFSKNMSEGARSSTEGSGWNSHTMHAAKVAEQTMNVRKSLRTLVLDKAAKTRTSNIAVERDETAIDIPLPRSPQFGQDSHSIEDNFNDNNHSIRNNINDDDNSDRDNSNDDNNSDRDNSNDDKKSDRDNSNYDKNSDRDNSNDDNNSSRDNINDDKKSDRDSSSDGNHAVRDNSNDDNNSDGGVSNDDNHAITDNSNDDNNSDRDDSIADNHYARDTTPNLGQDNYFVRDKSNDDNHSIRGDSSDDNGSPVFRKTTGNTTQTTMDAYIKKIKEENYLRNQIIEEKVKNAVKKPRSDPNLDARYFEYESKSDKRKVIKNKDKSPQHKGKNVQTKKNIQCLIIGETAYKPPKLYKPPKVGWISRYLYQFLNDKLKDRYQHNTRVESEKFVRLLFGMYKHCTKKSADVRPAVSTLKKRMAQLGLVTTHFDFYVNFVEKFMPKEFRVKVIPDLVNRLPLPKEGLFSEIKYKSSSVR